MLLPTRGCSGLKFVWEACVQKIEVLFPFFFVVGSGGLKFAWEAFVKNHAPDDSEKRLFFVAMGQTWCVCVCVCVCVRACGGVCVCVCTTGIPMYLYMPDAYTYMHTSAICS